MATDSLGLHFNDPDLLAEALTHRSYLNEHPEAKRHNERLEFLGDAVLELSVAHFLFMRFPAEQEGVLTKLTSALVNANSLRETAEQLGLPTLVRLSRGEAASATRRRDSIFADALEALIGALFLDQGFDAADAFVRKHICSKVEAVLASGSHEDAKSRLQERAQRQEAQTPHYVVLEERGPDHAREFVVAAYIGEEEVARGEGASKQEAEQAAASAALTALGW